MEFVGEFPNAAGVLIASLWNKHHVTLQVSSGFVMLAVGNLPREVWHKESRMADPASCVV